MASPKMSSRRRITWIVIVMTVMMAATLIFRVGYWQVLKSGWLQEKASDQWTRERPVAAKRGDILDTNGTVLAQSASCYMVMAIPKQVSDAEKKKSGELNRVIDTLSTELGLDKASIERKVKDTKKSEVLIKRQISREQHDRLLQIGLPGVRMSEDMKRYYPMRNFLTQVLGFTSVDGEGLEGVEARFNKYLAGTPGSIVSETDRDGLEVPGSVEQYIDPIDGENVTLTIDSVIQSFAEKAADRAMTEQKPKKVTILVMDPNTGAILADVAKPDFDNNNPPREDLAALREQVRNSAITDAYEPGSTFKILTIASGLDAGAVTADSRFYCPGYRIVDGEKIKCWTSNPHGSQNLYEGVQHSCNPVFMDIALKLGQEKFYQYLYSFGLGKKTGIDLNGEASGIVTAPKYVRNTDLARIGFGQSIAVTPLQLITAVSAAINGGSLMEPQIVKQVTNKDGGVVVKYDPKKLDQVIKPETSALVRDILLSVVEEGSGKNAKVEGYEVGGKTGTAQKYGPDGKILQNKHISSFIAFAPVDKPKYLVLVIVDEPDVAVDYGSIVAAPYVKMILEDALKYGNVPPKVQETQQPAETVEVPDCMDLSPDQAMSTLQSKGFKYIVEGYGGNVADQMPKPGSEEAKGSTVILYLEQVDDTEEHTGIEVPNLDGKTAVEVNNTLKALGLELKITGAGGVAVHQWPAEGDMVNVGDTVTVEFAYPEEETTGENKN